MWTWVVNTGETKLSSLSKFIWTGKIWLKELGLREGIPLRSLFCRETTQFLQKRNCTIFLVDPPTSCQAWYLTVLDPCGFPIILVMSPKPIIFDFEGIFVIAYLWVKWPRRLLGWTRTMNIVMTNDLVECNIRNWLMKCSWNWTQKLFFCSVQASAVQHEQSNSQVKPNLQWPLWKVR